MFDKINKKLREDNNEVKSEAKKFAEYCSKISSGEALLFTCIVGALSGITEIFFKKKNDRKRNF